MEELVDTHCHINFFKNAGDIALESEKKGIHTIYVTNLPSHFQDSFKYVKSLKYIYPALGFHPLQTNYDIELEKELFLSNLDKTDFIGEIGLDFSSRASNDKKKQLEIFEFILDSIKDKNKILSIHSTKAEEEILNLLQKYNQNFAILHWYSGTIKNLKIAIDLGYYFSINTQMIQTKKGMNIISKIPKNLLLTETDSPFIKCKPKDVEKIYNFLAEEWKIDISEVKKQILSNFFNLTLKKQTFLF